jgi:hypothetical protein
MRLAFTVAVAVFCLGCGVGGKKAPLRVCADPNNLPFSNQRAEGFENLLADIVARDAGQTVEYTWWPQRRGFIRSTLNAGLCDVVMGVPNGFDMALTTNPYYRSSFRSYRKVMKDLDVDQDLLAHVQIDTRRFASPVET